MADKPLACVPQSFKTIAAQTIHQRLKKYKRLVELELEQDDPDMKWVDSRIQMIEETQSTLDHLNEMPTCDG